MEACQRCETWIDTEVINPLPKRHFGESNVSIRVDVAVCGVKLKSIWARRLFVQPTFIYFGSNIGALRKSHGPEFPKHDHCSGLTSHRKAEAF